MSDIDATTDAPAPTTIPVVPTPTPAPQPAPQPETKAEKGLSQDEVNRIAAREKKAGERAAQAAILEELGASSLDEVKALVEAVKAADEAQKTEAQKAVERAQAAEQAAKEREAAAATALRQANITAALIGAGVADPTQRLELVPLVAAKVDADTDETAAVEKVKATFPQLFQPAPGQTPPPSGATTGTPPAGNPAGLQDRVKAGVEAWTRQARPVDMQSFSLD